MNLNKSTRLALCAVLEMAAAGDALVTVAGTAARHGISSHHLAKVFQQLVRTGLASAEQGVHGGYRLARSPKEISLLDVVEIFEGPVELQTGPLGDAPAGGDDPVVGRLRRVFDEIQRQAYFTLKSTRLSALLPAPGLRAKRTTQ